MLVLAKKVPLAMKPRIPIITECYCTFDKNKLILRLLNSPSKKRKAFNILKIKPSANLRATIESDYRTFFFVLFTQPALVIITIIRFHDKSASSKQEVQC